MDKKLKQLRIQKKNGKPNYWNPLTYLFLFFGTLLVICVVIWTHFFPVDVNKLK